MVHRDGDQGERDAEGQEQAAEDGATHTGPMLVGDLKRSHGFQRGHAGGGACGAHRCEYRHCNTEEHGQCDDLPAHIQRQSHAAERLVPCGNGGQCHEAGSHAHAEYRGHESEHTRLLKHRHVELALGGTDGAQQCQRTAALRHEHLERVRDDKRGDHQSEHTEGEQELLGHVTTVGAEGFDGLLFHMRAILQRQPRRKRGLHLRDHGGFMCRLDVQVRSGRWYRIEGGDIRIGDHEVVRGDGGTVVIAIHVVRIGGETRDRRLHVLRIVAMLRMRRDGVSHLEVPLLGKLPRYCNLPGTIRFGGVALYDRNREQLGVGTRRQRHPAAVLGAGIQYDTARDIGTDAFHSPDARYGIELKTTNR